MRVGSQKQKEQTKQENGQGGPPIQFQVPFNGHNQGFFPCFHFAMMFSQLQQSMYFQAPILNKRKRSAPASFFDASSNQITDQPTNIKRFKSSFDRQTCSNPHCKKYAKFGFPDSPIPVSCKFHCVNGMVNLVTPRCEEISCSKHPAFAFPGERPRFCKEHSFLGMIDVINRRCEHEECIKHRVFAFEGESPRFCKVHSQPGMVDVKSKKCMAHDCCKHPSFGFPNGRPSFCKTHSAPGMINILIHGKQDNS
mmetsp:Transcript_26013/g.34120  ORF Transcript_26013/g.34120 Transcript_26013/m.34120 type:complete len:252 (-) Transcript_26013:128-883(-)